MGWSELVRGSWWPKRTFSTCLTIDGELPVVTICFELVFSHNPSQKKLALLASRKG